MRRRGVRRKAPPRRKTRAGAEAGGARCRRGTRSEAPPRRKARGTAEARDARRRHAARREPPPRRKARAAASRQSAKRERRRGAYRDAPPRREAQCDTEVREARGAAEPPVGVPQKHANVHDLVRDRRRLQVRNHNRPWLLVRTNDGTNRGNAIFDKYSAVVCTELLVVQNCPGDAIYGGLLLSWRLECLAGSHAYKRACV